jgi:RNA polymerase sigma-70 factor (ECF subfamily)
VGASIAIAPVLPAPASVRAFWKRAVPRRPPVTSVPRATPVPPQDWSHCLRAIAAHGDRDAFAMLFRHFAPRVKSYLLRCHMPPAQAEELAQETLLMVWRKASYFDPARASASTWIFTIARNLRVDALRGTAHPEALMEELVLPSDDPLPADLVLASQRETKMRRALVALPEDQAEVVRLSFFEDKPHVEIARELGIPLGTVKSRLRLAFGRLRAALEDVA